MFHKKTTSHVSRAKALRNVVILGRHHCSRHSPLGNGFSALFALFQGFPIIEWAKIHPLPVSRRYAANWVRFPKSAVFGERNNFPRANLAELSAAVCCDFEDNRHCSHFVRDSGGFPLRRILWAHHYRNAAHSPFLQQRLRANRGALTQKRGFATRRRLFNIARFSDAQQIFLA